MQDHKPRITIGLAAILFGAALISINGCGYGKVSPKAYEYATALYSIANRQDSARLDKIEPMLTQAQTSGEITARESQWLQSIIAEARAGDWNAATAQARRMMTDQVARN